MINQETIENNAKLAKLVFDNKPQYFEYIRNKFNVDEDNVIATHYYFWRPDLNWNQLNMVLDSIAEIEGVIRLELEYNYKNFLIDFENKIIRKKHKNEGRNKFILNVWDGCVEFYDKYLK